jgi:hypothetical protein
MTPYFLRTLNVFWCERARGGFAGRNRSLESAFDETSSGDNHERRNSTVHSFHARTTITISTWNERRTGIGILPNLRTRLEITETS